MNIVRWQFRALYSALVVLGAAGVYTLWTDHGRSVPPGPGLPIAPIVQCDCTKTAEAKPPVENPLPVPKNRPKPEAPLKSSRMCRYVPAEAYKHPPAVVLAEAKRRGLSAENMAQLRRCIGG